MAPPSRSRRGSPPKRVTHRSLPAAHFKAHCLELMNEVHDRRVEYVVTKRGKAVAKLVACDDTPPDGFGALAGTVVELGDIVGPDHESWEAVD